jgi:trehalose 6-phosphate synthase
VPAAAFPRRIPYQQDAKTLPKKPPGRLIVVSNRLPFSLRRAAGRWRADPASGGLVTALLPVLRDRGGTWVGWTGATGPIKDFAPALRAVGSDAGYALVGVPLGAAELHGFYHGFANEVVWPLFHDLPSLCNFEPQYWRTYCAVNRKYARAVHARAGAGAFVWAHDYHLMNLA